MKEIAVRTIGYGSREYRLELELRNRILRLPLGLDLLDEDLSGEENDVHIGAFQGKRLAGVLVLTGLNSISVRMRQVAVDENLQGGGIGRRMVSFSEHLAQDKGYAEMVLHARKTAVDFYLKQGYEITGGEFFEAGIPHVEMKKQLTG